MSLPQRYVVGIGGISLGNALLAVSYFLDRTLLGPFTTLALVVTSIAALTAAVSFYVVRANPDDFDSEGWNGALITLAGGLAAILAGLITLTLTVLG